MNQVMASAPRVAPKWPIKGVCIAEIGMGRRARHLIAKET
jgi:hypothetical protein